MVLELARSAIYIKMAAKVESPIISTFEYCFAAGLAFSKLQVPEEEKNRIRDLEEFTEIKREVSSIISDSDVFSSFEYGERLKSLLLGCRIKNEMTQEARELFDLGFQEK